MKRLLWSWFDDERNLEKRLNGASGPRMSADDG